MKFFSYFDSLSNKEYQYRKKYFYEGSSPNLLDYFINYISLRIEEIEAIYVVWYLYNNVKLNSFLKEISKKGIKIVVISIPLEGYDKKLPSNIYNADNSIFSNAVTKYDIATQIYDDLYKGLENFRLYEFPHTFVRSKSMKVFSRGDLPYSLHTKSIYIHYKSTKRGLLLSSSNFAMRDKTKEENMIILETESKDEIKEILPMYNFLKDMSKHIRPMQDNNKNNDYNNKLNQTLWKNSDTFYIMSPFYRDSPTIIKNKINSIIMKSKKRVYITSQHLSGSNNDSIVHSILKKGHEGIDICCITQTSSDKRGGRHVKNSLAFKLFLDKFMLLGSNSKYYINDDIHSKYIIVDDIIIVTTFNFTPTQFTYIENVKIPSFNYNSELSYEGTHSEVGHMLIIKDMKTVQSYYKNFLNLIKNKSTVQLK